MTDKPICLHTETRDTPDDPWGGVKQTVITGWTCTICGATHQPPKKRTYPRGWTIQGEIADHLIQRHGATGRTHGPGCACGFDWYTDDTLGGSRGADGRHRRWHDDWLMREWAA